MRKLSQAFRIIFSVMIVTSCTQTETLAPISQFAPEEIAYAGQPIDLRPLNSEHLVDTLIEFLIDDSNSVESKCKTTGMRRYDFTNFILNILPTIPEPLWQKLSVGVASFGNGNNPDSNYTTLIPPESFDPLVHKVSKPDGPGTYQSIVHGIEKSTTEMNLYSAQQKVLVIITDGMVTQPETIEIIRNTLVNKADFSNLSVIIALICENDDSVEWKNIANKNIHVLDLEDAARFLFANYLKAFLPDDIYISPSNYEPNISIGGYYTSARTAYWNSELQNPSLIVTTTTRDQVWGTDAILSHPYAIDHRNECSKHTLTIPPIGIHGLLVIQPRTFQGLRLSIGTTPEEGSVEVINNTGVTLQIQVFDKGDQNDLRDWVDCFQLALFEPNGTPADIVTPIPLNNNYPLQAGENFGTIYGNTQWWPSQFQTPTFFGLVIKIGSLQEQDVSIWETAPINIPINFMAEHESSDTYMPSDWQTYTEAQQVTFNIGFTYIASDPKIYLATQYSDVELDQIKNNKDRDGSSGNDRNIYPNPSADVNDQVLSEIKLDASCSLSLVAPGEVYACILSFPSLKTLGRTFTFSIYKYVISDYGFNKVFIVWEEVPGTKAKIWICSIDNFIQCNNELQELNIRER